MMDDLITAAEEIILADEGRAEQARWLALCELALKAKDVATPAGFARWCEAVNKRTEEIFARLN